MQVFETPNYDLETGTFTVDNLRLYGEWEISGDSSGYLNSYGERVWELEFRDKKSGATFALDFKSFGTYKIMRTEFEKEIRATCEATHGLQKWKDPKAMLGILGILGTLGIFGTIGGILYSWYKKSAKHVRSFFL